MGSPLPPVLAGILMVELEGAVIPKLSQHLQFWKRHVNDTICFVCNGYKNFCYHASIVFIISSNLQMKWKNEIKYSFLTF